MTLNKFKKLKIGILGCGYWATNIIKSLEEEGLYDISVFDIDKKKLRIIKDKFRNLKIYKSLNSFFANNYNCIFLVAPPSKHYNLAKKVLKKNIDLFVEKPLTLSSKHLKELIKLSYQKKLILMSGYIYQHNIYVDYIKTLLKKGTLGRIKYVYFERSNLGPIRNDTSCIWDLASHDISTCISIFKNKPRITYVKTFNFLKKNLHDISSVGLEFGNIKVEIRSSWLNPEKVRKIIIIGEKKMLQFDEMENVNKIKIYNKYASYPDIKTFKKEFFTPKANIYLGKTHTPKIIYKSPMKLELKNFFECIRYRKTPKSSAVHALKVMNVLEKIDKMKN